MGTVALSLCDRPRGQSSGASVLRRQRVRSERLTTPERVAPKEECGGQKRTGVPPHFKGLLHSQLHFAQSSRLGWRCLLFHMNAADAKRDEPSRNVPQNRYAKQHSNRAGDRHCILRPKYGGNESLLNKGLNRLNDARRPLALTLYPSQIADL